MIVLMGPSGVGMGQFEGLLLLVCIYMGLKIHEMCQVGPQSCASVMVPGHVCVQMWLHILGVHVCAWGLCVHLCAGEGVSSMIWGSMALDPCCTHSEKSQPLTGPILGEASVL